MLIKKVSTLTFGVFFFLSGFTAVSQPALTPQNMAMGGGGTAYITGYDANFYNPANLMVKTRTARYQIGVGQTALHFDPVLSSPEPRGQLNNLRSVFRLHNSAKTTIDETEREAIINNYYRNEQSLSQHISKADIIAGGAHWQRHDLSLSVAARIRLGTRTLVGRGWYSEENQRVDDRLVRDFSLTRQSSALYEVSFGYAQRFDFIDGLIPKLSNLYIGIAPKIVIAGPHFDAEASISNYQQSEDASGATLVHSFDYRSAGAYSEATSQYLHQGDSDQAVSANLGGNFLTNPAGYGGGFDAGLTYVVALGGNVSGIRETENRTPLRNSLRLSISATDIGMIRYHENPLQLRSASERDAISLQEPRNQKFIGAPGQYLTFLDTADPQLNPFENPDLQTESPYFDLLPASFNAGMVMQYRNTTLSGDITVGLTDNAFNDNNLTAHLGMEIYPLKRIPLRFGTQFSANRPTFLGIGSGFEHRNIQFSLGARLGAETSAYSSELIGAVSAVKIQF